ncbi:taurine dioxygenase [Novosphingobium nitrogenifigens]
MIVEPLTPSIGGLVTGMDLSRPLTDEARAELKAALVERQVLFFRDQTLTEVEQRDLAAGFGPLHIHPIYPSAPNVPEIMVLDTALNDLRDNATWHSDVSFTKSPSFGAVLLAKQVPEVGGDTLWASAAAAYDALPEGMKTWLATLEATHDIAKSFPAERFGFDEETKLKLEAAKRSNPPITHPVIRTLPDTGRKVIFVSEGFTTGIVGMEPPLAEPLLAMLFAHVIRPEFTVRWKWRAGDVAIWDNRSTQHYATYDYGKTRRVMNRATIVGDPVV